MNVFAAIRAVPLALLMLSSVAAHTAGNKLVITGSSTVAPLTAEIAKRFESRNPGTRIDVQTGGSSRGANDARQGLADIGMVSRSLKPEERDLIAHTIALDGVSVIVNKANPVTHLTPEQVVAIYSGAVRNWKDVGGKDETITVINKAEGRSTLELFTQHFKLTNSQIKAQVVIGDNQQGIKTVAGVPGAIGYVSIGSAEYEQEQGTAIRLVPTTGVAATVNNVRNGTYPLMRPLNLVTKEPPTGLAKRFIDFASSPAVADLIKEQFFVPPAFRS